MMTSVGVMRSGLFVPGHRSRMVEKGLGSTADGLYFDLEDAVPADEKDNARLTTAEALGRVGDKIGCVRVNGLESGLLLADLEAVVRPGLAAVVVPKVEDGDAIRHVGQLLSELEPRVGLPSGSVGIVATLETASGIANARDIVRASARIRSVVIGTAEDGDLQRDLGYAYSESRIELVYVISHVVVQARAAKIAEILAGPFVKFEDDLGLERDAVFARGLGCTGKLAIHPRQLDVINQVFSPSAEEVARYERVAAAVLEAHQRGLGAVTVDGRMVDQAMLERARSVIEAARRSRGRAAPAD